jgi:integrase
MIWTPAQLGQFLDDAETDRLYALFCLIGHCALRHGEACGLAWSETDFQTPAVTVSSQIVQVRYKPVTGAPKTDASLAHVRLEDVTVAALKAWRKAQLVERIAWGRGWTDAGLVFTHEDGTAYHPAQVSARFERIAYAAGLPPIRLHDLRHGAATLAGAADIKAVSSMPGRWLGPLSLGRWRRSRSHAWHSGCTGPRPRSAPIRR